MRTRIAIPRSRVALQVRIWLVGRDKPRRWKHRGIAMCGITGDKDGCATLVQSASKTSVCRYYSRHPLLDGGNKKKSVPRSHWVYASRIWRSNVSRSACRSGPFCRWSRAPLVSRDHTRYFFFPFFPPFQREKIYSYEYIEYGRAFCFVFSLRRLFALFFFFFFLIEAII